MGNWYDNHQIHIDGSLSLRILDSQKQPNMIKTLAFCAGLGQLGTRPQPSVSGKEFGLKKTTPYIMKTTFQANI